MILQPVRSLEDCQHNFDQIQQQQVFAGVGAPEFWATGGSLYVNKAVPHVAMQTVYFNDADGVNWTGIL